MDEAMIIGVFGHRDIIKEDKILLQNKIVRFLRGIQTEYPTRPLIVISSLAEGAERVAAKAALAAYADLHVLLPLPQGEYEKSLSGQESVQEFKRLLGKASHVIHLQGDLNDDQHADNKVDLRAEIGQYLNEQSDILLALWDGSKQNIKPGETASVVKQRLKSKDGPIDGLVYQIKTPRQSNQNLSYAYSQAWLQSW